MKDLLKSKKGTQLDKKAKAKDLVSSRDDVQNFLQKVSNMPVSSGDARLVFALDATASRQATWDTASQLQTEMFVSAQSLGGLQVQLCYFRGFGEFYSSSWQSSPDALLNTMTGITCQAGATQLQRLLRHVITENDRNKIKCVVYIGDAMEENIDILAHLAGKLGLLNIRLFMFQERGDPIARQAYLEMSRLAGGAYCQFDAASADQLKDLLRAVAIYAAGGMKALVDFSKKSHKTVKLLQQQLKQ